MKTKLMKLTLFIISIATFLTLAILNLKSDFKEVLKRDCSDALCSQNQQILKSALQDPLNPENKDIICKASITDIEKTGYWKKTITGMKGFLASSDYFLIGALINAGIILLIYGLFIIVAWDFNLKYFISALLVSVVLSFLLVHLMNQHRIEKNKKMTIIQIDCTL